MEEQTTRRGPSKTVIVAIVVILLLAGSAFGLYAAGVIGPKDPPALQYASKGVVLIDDQDVNETLEDNAIALEFKNDAYSLDGKTFQCYVGNSPINLYDMFLAIYSDASFTEELWVSDLVPPGSAFEEITLNKALEPGVHTVCIAFTQMEDDAKTIHAQTLYTMDFHVSPDA